MLLILLILGAVALAVPIIAAVAVAVASRREEHLWSIAGPAPGPFLAAARRIVGFRAENIEWLRYAGQVRARRLGRAPAGERRRRVNRQARRLGTAGGGTAGRVTAGGVTAGGGTADVAQAHAQAITMPRPGSGVARGKRREDGEGD